MLARPAPWLLLAAAAACHQPSSSQEESGAGPAGPAGGAGPERIWSFEESGLPHGFRADETNSDGTPGAWSCEPDSAAPDGARVLRLVTSNTGATFNLLLTEDAMPADVDLSVRLRADGGAEDQGGGLVWRVRDRDNYWLARWNPLEKNLRLYAVRGGVRRMAASAGTEAAAADWHELRVLTRGDAIEVRFDGEQLLALEDPELGDGGPVGLWTKADASTSFDALRLALPAPPGGPVPGPEPR